MSNSLSILTPQQLDTIKRTIAKDCTPTEFDLFITTASRYKLDPFRRQIFPQIFNKSDSSKRSMTIIMSRDGLRCIASRGGDYRPASKPVEVAFDKELTSTQNPKGILSATVYLWKQDKQTREWFEVAGQAYWDEFAPLKDVWEWNEQKGKKLPNGEKILDTSGQWGKMPIVMLSKCAESQALRAGWPEDFSGLYIEDEMDKAISDDLSASQMAELGRAQAVEKTLQYKGKVASNFSGAIEHIAVGEYHDTWQKYFEQYKDSPQILLTLRDNNREGLRQFHSHEKDAALDLKRKFERLETQVLEATE